MREPDFVSWPASRTYRVRPADPGDVRAFPARADLRAEMEASGEALEEIGPFRPDGRVLGWTLLRRDRPVGIAWLTDVGEGVWDLGAYVSDLDRRDWAYARAAARRALAWCEQGLGGRRIRVVVRCDNIGAIRFAEKLGFAAREMQYWPTGAYLLMVREA